MLKLVFLVLNLCVLWVSCSKPIGVPIERASLYDLKKPFACLDGSGVIPSEQINDDYCDCPDGSDEPGTSACPNGSFACQNLGFIVTHIPSSRVNDGVCDCCDGSDEYNGKKKCENTCDVLAQKLREEEERTRQLLEVGLAKKEELMVQGAEIRRKIRASLAELEAKLANAENEKKRLETLKNEAEAKAKEATDLQDKIFEEEKQRLAAIERERKAVETFAALDTNQDGILSAQELSVHSELDILFDNDGSFSLEEAQKFLDEQENVDAKMFLEMYYDKVSPHLKFETDKPAETTTETTTEHHEEGTEEHAHDDHDHEHEHDGDEHEHEHEHEETHYEPPKTGDKPKYDDQTSALLDEASKAKNAYYDADREFNSISNEISNAKRKLEYDVGLNEEFASMIDTCFEFEDREYIYRLCPFDRTVQKSKSNSGETSIGSWSSWGSDNDKYKQMIFLNGLTCWNGPARSTKVHLSCGSENKVTSVSEPNRCEYEMRFETPAACDFSNASGSNYSHTEL